MRKAEAICCAVISLFLCLTGAATAQPLVVKLPVAVEWKEDKALPLAAANFVVYENGKQQELIKVLGPDSPMIVMLAINTATVDANLLDIIKRSTIGFVNALPEHAQVALLEVKLGTKLLLQPTGDRARIAEALGSLGSGGTSTILESLEQIASSAAGTLQKYDDARVAMVVMTRGISFGNYRDMVRRGQVSGRNPFGRYDDIRRYGDKISNGLKAIVSLPPLYALHIGRTGLGDSPAPFTPGLGNVPSLHGRGGSLEGPVGSGEVQGMIEEASLNDIAKDAGGVALYPTEQEESISEHLMEIAKALRSTYVVSYATSFPKPDGKIRKVEVKLLNEQGKGIKDAGLRYRETYRRPKE